MASEYFSFSFAAYPGHDAMAVVFAYCHAGCAVAGFCYGNAMGKAFDIQGWWCDCVD